MLPKNAVSVCRFWSRFIYSTCVTYYTGLALSGSWGCFHDFHRIDVQVLSVAAQLIENLLRTRKGQKRLTTDLGVETTQTGVSPDCAVFCTQVRQAHAARLVLRNIVV